MDYRETNPTTHTGNYLMSNKFPCFTKRREKIIDIHDVMFLSFIYKVFFPAASQF